MTAQATLPPITLNLVIGTVGDRNEPLMADHLNTGITAKDASMLDAQPPEGTKGDNQLTRLASILAFGAAGFGLSGSFVNFRFGTDPQWSAVSMTLIYASFISLALALVIGLRETAKARRRNAAADDFSQAVKAVLRFQDKLLELPFISHYDHFADVDMLRNVLEESRLRLMSHAVIKQEPVVGEPELLAALEALGDYARTEHPTTEQYVGAHNAVGAFITVQRETTRKPEADRASL